MAHEKQLTAKTVALAVLQKVGTMLKNSKQLKTESLTKSEDQAPASFKPDPHSDGKYSLVPAPEEPEAGRASHPSKCPEPGHPSEATGEGNPLRRTKAQEDWQEKSEEMTKNERIRELQKSGMSPNQIHAQLQKDEELAKKYEGFKAVEESARKGGASDPAAVAAAVGRKKYGKEAFQHAAAEGHKMGKAELDTDLEGLEVLLKGETENSKKLGYKLSDAGKKEVTPEKSDHAFDTKPESAKSSDDARLGHTPSPEKNPKEQAEGNNELAGTTPTQVDQDGKNKPGYDEMKGHLKLAKFIGMTGYKKAKKHESSQAQSEGQAQHTESIKDK